MAPRATRRMAARAWARAWAGRGPTPGSGSSASWPGRTTRSTGPGARTRALRRCRTAGRSARTGTTRARGWPRRLHARPASTRRDAWGPALRPTACSASSWPTTPSCSSPPTCLGCRRRSCPTPRPSSAGRRARRPRGSSTLATCTRTRCSTTTRASGPARPGPLTRPTDSMGRCCASWTGPWGSSCCSSTSWTRRRTRW
mmetsp:Transcript_20105/g.67538  ORF Transcript_20105/g.67538 Transcript_20105/m.67538 type:complete len:200 (-) Transcript_20105:1173-1772(-)